MQVGAEANELQDRDRVGVSDGVSAGGGTALIVSQSMDNFLNQSNHDQETDALDLSTGTGQEKEDTELEEASNSVAAVKDSDRCPLA